MAFDGIALQDGKVLLQDGKVLDCCCAEPVRCWRRYDARCDCGNEPTPIPYRWVPCDIDAARTGDVFRDYEPTGTSPAICFLRTATVYNGEQLEVLDRPFERKPVTWYETCEECCGDDTGPCTCQELLDASPPSSLLVTFSSVRVVGQFGPGPGGTATYEIDGSLVLTLDPVGPPPCGLWTNNDPADICPLLTVIAAASGCVNDLSGDCDGMSAQVSLACNFPVHDCPDGPLMLYVLSIEFVTPSLCGGQWCICRHVTPCADDAIPEGVYDSGGVECMATVGCPGIISGTVTVS